MAFSQEVGKFYVRGGDGAVSMYAVYVGSTIYISRYIAYIRHAIHTGI
jgi:hypothetical protein